MDKTGALQVVAQDDADKFLVDQDPADQPMAPADQYQMPTTTSLPELVNRQLNPIYPDGVTSDQCILQVDEVPIYLDNYVQIPGQVTFDLKQVWKATKHISWIAVDYEYRRAYSCDDINRNPCTAGVGGGYEADDPTQYIQCEAGLCNLMNCGSGKMWDQDLLECVDGTPEKNRPGCAPQGGRRCKKKNKVKYNFDKRMSKFTAMCDPVSNTATIDIYLYDGSKAIAQADGVDRSSLIPDYCSPSNKDPISSWSKSDSSDSSKSSSSKSRRRLTAEVDEDMNDELLDFGRRRLGSKSSSSTKSGSGSSSSKKSAGKAENNACLYQYVIDCGQAVTGRRRLQTLEPSHMFHPQQVKEDHGGYTDLQPQVKHRRSLFSRVSSAFKASNAPRPDRALLANEEQELPLFGGPKVMGICPKGVSKRTGEVVFNGYRFG